MLQVELNNKADENNIRDIQLLPGVNPGLRVILTSGKTITFHSPYDPFKEARLQINDVRRDGRNLYILLGYGLGYIHEVLLAEADPGSDFIVIEPSELIFKLARQRCAEITEPGLKTTFLIDKESFKLGSVLHSMLSGKSYQDLVIVMHPPSATIYDSLFKMMLQEIQKEVYHQQTNLSTLDDLALTYIKHKLQNLRTIIENPGVKNLFGKFEGIPAILISAGPSLDKNWHYLHFARSKALLIAVDTALKPLLRRGIEPHIVVSADPSKSNYRHLHGVKVKSSLLVAEPMVNPNTYSWFPGKIRIASFGDAIMEFFKPYTGEKGILNVWGSVATVAFDLAFKLKANPIIFMGQDLSYPGDHAYCHGTYWEEEQMNQISPETFWNNLLANRALIIEKDLTGHPVKTTNQLASYARWFQNEMQKHPHIHWINATEGGIVSDCVTKISMHELTHKILKNEVSVEKILYSKSNNIFSKNNYRMLFEKILSAAKELDLFTARTKSVIDSSLTKSTPQLF
ncbi:MAG: hypothetical protein A2161_20140, partial [Candidatus Schekmanbacteria bacterium RBG_13_48_7]